MGDTIKGSEEGLGCIGDRGYLAVAEGEDPLVGRELQGELQRCRLGAAREGARQRRIAGIGAALGVRHGICMSIDYSLNSGMQASYRRPRNVILLRGVIRLRGGLSHASTMCCGNGEVLRW